MVAAGNARSFALKADGTVWSWGNNTFGSLGDGTSINRSSPAQVAGVSNMVRIVTHSTSFDTFAIRSDGTLWTLGSATPSQYGTGNDYLRAAVGDSNYLAVRSAGQLWSWGNNYNSSNGRGTTINNSDAPAPIPALSRRYRRRQLPFIAFSDGFRVDVGQQQRWSAGNLNGSPVASAPLIVRRCCCRWRSGAGAVLGIGGADFCF
jgi:alpha-tubulin suppressor-like RCC1 family protein